MRVAVMAVGQMRMRVAQRDVHMKMAVHRVGRTRRVVRMAVMLVVRVAMFVRDFAVRMRMFVALAQMQPHADRHQGTGGKELHLHRLAEKRDGHKGAHKRREAEIGTCARRTQIAQGTHEQRQTYPIAQKSGQQPKPRNAEVGKDTARAERDGKTHGAGHEPLRPASRARASSRRPRRAGDYNVWHRKLDANQRPGRSRATSTSTPHPSFSTAAAPVW